VVSVGGILDLEEAVVRLDMGAELVELYTGWIYGGPALPWDIAKALGSISV
jgi:dihydroorotate dehydrogenase